MFVHAPTLALALSVSQLGPGTDGQLVLRRHPSHGGSGQGSGGRRQEDIWGQGSP